MSGTGMNQLTSLLVQDSHLHQPRPFIVLLNKNFYYIVNLSLARFIVRAVLTVALMILLCDSIIKIFKIDINQKPQSWLHKEITKLVLSTIIILADSVADSGYTKTKEAFQILNSMNLPFSSLLTFTREGKIVKFIFYKYFTEFRYRNEYMSLNTLSKSIKDTPRKDWLMITKIIVLSYDMFFPKIIPTNPPISPSKISKETFKLSSVTGTLLSLWVNKKL